MEKHNKMIFEKISELVKEGKKFVLATIIEASAGSPGRTGFKMILTNDGKTYGTLGGGELEYQSTKEMKEVMKQKKSKTLKYSLTPDLKMACGGKVTLFLEYFDSIKTAWLFGGGHLAVDLTPVLALLGFRVNVIDNRKEYAEKSRFLNVNEVINNDYLEFAETFNPSNDDSIVVFTHGHTFDYDILNILCKRNLNVKYLGVIGAENKIRKIRKKIINFNYEGNLIDRVYGPIGLNIATKTTSEIAVSIAAEILAVYNGVEEIKFMSKK